MGTAGTYRWMQTFFPKIPVLKVTVPYLGTVNFFAHESHCTVGTKKFLVPKALKNFFLHIHFQFVPMVHFFSHIQSENVPAVHFFYTFNWKMYQRYRFFCTKYLGSDFLATFGHLKPFFGYFWAKIEKIFPFCTIRTYQW